MDPSLTQMIDTLRTAREALRSEMAVWVVGSPPDEARLEHLLEMARSFREQAHSVLVMTVYQDTPEALRQEIDGLIAGFSDIVEQVDTMLARSRWQR
ncbi:hypothetical protein Rumeso_04896 [Rubellimicrobium mesophilum DSM 19309]|uniref:Uncharacterized protein n=1 Tax=Rubellimicrobium mesophilum DSM 19309 TaxID=442562 RepID=A0A017HB11_9RHOB|nr:hypothetical protein [Rubellimicrobium mesophilum]EYD71495.1 hypothetical protein Rumeso_04896 [Rubellimicrobium mesophilum DSM 19309]